MSYMTLPHKKNTFFTLFILSHASDNTTSQNIGGPMHGPSPTSNFGGGSPPSPPRFPPLPLGSLRRSPRPHIREGLLAFGNRFSRLRRLIPPFPPTQNNNPPYPPPHK